MDLDESYFIQRPNIQPQSHQHATYNLPPLQQQPMSLHQIPSAPGNIYHDVLPPIVNNRVQPLNVAQPQAYVSSSAATTTFAAGGAGTAKTCTPLAAVLATFLTLTIIGGVVAGIVAGVGFSMSSSSSSSILSSLPSSSGSDTCSGFTCNSGSCIPSSYLCDAIKDCPDNEDEESCDHTTTTTVPTVCAAAHFYCYSGTFFSSSPCIDLSKRCDGLNHCTGGEDEQNCAGQCSTSQFECIHGSVYGNCILASWQCDGIKDCNQDTDEMNCATPTAAPATTIGPDQYQCNGSPDTVILKNKLCDQTEDCPGGTDEDRCIISPDGNQMGNVKVYSLPSNGHFHLCGTADGWDDSKSDAVCVALGFTTATSTTEEVTTELGIKCTAAFSLQQLAQQSAETCTDNKIVKISCDSTSTCGIAGTPTPSSSKIVGGEDTVISASPWQVLLRKHGLASCGGTIVSDRWVVTSAHCVDSLPATTTYTSVDIVAGITTLSESSSSDNIYPIDKIVYHPLYDDNSLINDIAVIHMTKDFDFSSNNIQPACLPLPGMVFKDNVDVIATGWGSLHSGGPASETLQTVTLPLVNLETCKSDFSKIALHLKDGMICAGLPAGEKDTCQGDSGGPLTTSHESRQHLVGATSWGIGCGLPGRPGVYAEIAYYTDWIKREMNKPIA